MCQLAPPGVNTHEVWKGSRVKEPLVDDAGLTSREDGKEEGEAGRKSLQPWDFPRRKVLTSESSNELEGAVIIPAK